MSFVVFATESKWQSGSLCYNSVVILITGATGFIGRALLRQLLAAGREVRIALHPSRTSPRLPRGVPLEVAVVSLSDERAIQAALKGVEVVFHLAGSEWRGKDADLFAVDMRGTERLANLAAQAGVKRLVYLSHLGASRAAGYPVFKAKGIAEEHIRRSGVAHTIFRSGLVFGPEDHFTTVLARLLRASPFFFPIPGGERTVVQPLWVEDLIAVMLWSLEDEGTLNQTYEIGGSEYFTARQILEIIMQVTQRRRLLLEVNPALLRAWIVMLEAMIPNYPLSSFWMDYLAVSRTCPADALPRTFGLMPARFAYRLDYLKRTAWYMALWRGTTARLSKATAQALETVRTLRL